MKQHKADHDGHQFAGLFFTDDCSHPTPVSDRALVLLRHDDHYDVHSNLADEDAEDDCAADLLATLCMEGNGERLSKIIALAVEKMAVSQVKFITMKEVN